MVPVDANEHGSNHGHEQNEDEGSEDEHDDEQGEGEGHEIDDLEDRQSDLHATSPHPDDDGKRDTGADPAQHAPSSRFRLF